MTTAADVYASTDMPVRVDRRKLDGLRPHRLTRTHALVLEVVRPGDSASDWYLGTDPIEVEW
jgi:hypothetical protein